MNDVIPSVFYELCGIKHWNVNVYFKKFCFGWMFWVPSLLASLPPVCLYCTEARLGHKSSGPFKQSLIREDLFLFISTCPENTHYPKVVKILWKVQISRFGLSKKNYVGRKLGCHRIQEISSSCYFHIFPDWTVWLKHDWCIKYFHVPWKLYPGKCL